MTGTSNARIMVLGNAIGIKAWTSQELFSWYGANYEYRYVNIWPRPVQQPHPPIYIPGQDQPRR